MFNQHTLLSESDDYSTNTSDYGVPKALQYNITKILPAYHNDNTGKIGGWLLVNQVNIAPLHLEQNPVDKVVELTG